VKEKLVKNWKTRRKKPPDKEVEIRLISSNMKEMNQLKKEVERIKRLERKKRKSYELLEKQLKIEDMNSNEILLSNSVKHDASKRFYCSVWCDVKRSDLEQETLEREYRSLDIEFEYHQKLIKLEANVICQGQEMNLLMLPTVERTRVFMDYKTCNKKIAINQDFLDEAEKITN
jgi:hypothetical protein